MARYSNGINGAFTGKVGAVVGVVRKGTHYMRAMPSKRTGLPTAGEALNRRKFAMAQEWLAPIKDFVREGFRGYSEKAEGFIAAKSYLLKHAFEGEGQALAINPALVKLSWGDLPLPGEISWSISGHRITITWDAGGGEGTDQLMALVRLDNAPHAAISILYGQMRRHGQEEIPLPGIKGIIHLYVAFVSADRSRRSMSEYLGTATIE